MDLYRIILMWFSLATAGVLTVVGFAVWCDQHQVFPGRRILRAFRNLPWPVQFFLLAFSLQMIVHGSMKTNAVGDVEGAAQQRGRGVRHAPYGLQDDAQQRGRDILVACSKAASAFFSRDRNVASPLGAEGDLFSRDRNVASPLSGAGQTVTPEEIARGWRFVGVDTNTTVDYAMPEGAVLASNWWVRGCFDDVVKIGNGEPGMGNGGWSFLFGDTWHDSLWALTWGRLRFVLGDAATEIVAVGSPMSAIPFVSRLWTVAATNGKFQWKSDA